jgi:hypothetical protein
MIGKFTRRSSPLTRIIGDNPADKCKSEALFFTTNVNKSAISIYNPRAIRYKTISFVTAAILQVFY